MNDLAGITELAEMLGLSRTAIYDYIARDDLGFPAPEVDLSRRRLWSRQAVADWAARTLPLPEGTPAHEGDPLMNAMSGIRLVTEKSGTRRYRVSVHRRGRKWEARFDELAEAITYR